MTGIESILEGKSICICAGSGGVGKTTTSAAIAAAMAARGRKVAVLTIDPAKRLADSLGLEELGNEPTRVDPQLLADAANAAGDGAGSGDGSGSGELWAMMLDAKATFDSVVDRHAPDEESRKRILENRIYKQISGALAGSQEYMAMERLYELHEEGRFDLLVLDTPPSRNAIDFLEAPRRLLQFIEGRSLQLFIRPTGIGMRVLGRGSSIVFSVLKRVTGLDLIRDLTDFFGAMSGMIAGFKQRAARVEEVLGAPESTFVVVCGPSGETIREAGFLREKLEEASLPLGAVIVNRVHSTAAESGSLPEAELAKLLGDADLAGRVNANHRDYRALAERDAAAIARLRREVGTETPVVTVPWLTEDVHDLAGLFAINRHLTA